MIFDLRGQYYFSDWVDGLYPNPDTNPGNKSKDWNIWLSIVREDTSWALHVRDDGKGISGDALTRVFELFSQVEAGSEGGLGIGLSLVRGLVEMHGGSVAAYSAGEGQGSEFIVRLPIDVSEAPTAVYPNASVVEPPAAARSR